MKIGQTGKCMSTRSHNDDGWGWPSSTWGFVIHTNCKNDNGRMTYNIDTNGIIRSNAKDKKTLCISDQGDKHYTHVLPVWGTSNCISFNNENGWQMKAESSSTFRKLYYARRR